MNNDQTFDPTCCGGPAPEETDACCAADQEAKDKDQESCCHKENSPACC